MPISDDRSAQTLRYYFTERWRVGTVAHQLGVHHSTVESVLRAAGIDRARQRQRRPSMLGPYLAFITATLEQFPTLSAARLFDIAVALGYPGGADNFRHRIAQLRPRRPREVHTTPSVHLRTSRRTPTGGNSYARSRPGETPLYSHDSSARVGLADHAQVR